MADNYIERKMEELRRGSQKRVMPARRSTAKAGKLSFDFPARRVLLCGLAAGLGDGIATVFLDAGCKVAVFNVDSGQGSKMAREKGVRFYCVDVNDSAVVQKAFADLLKAWRDVDIIINMEAGEDYRVAIARMWSEHKTRYPFPSSYGGRLIDIDGPSFEKTSFLSEYGITVNCVSVAGRNAKDVIDMCMFLSLPQAGFIHGSGKC